MSNLIEVGDCVDLMRRWIDDGERVQTCVTSPPYFGLRDYGVPPTDWPEVQFLPMPGLPPVTVPAMQCCLGLESDITAFVGHIVLVFRYVWELLTDDGTLWLNLGDSYCSKGGLTPQSGPLFNGRARQHEMICLSNRTVSDGLKPKDLVGQPWRVAFALQADGWFLRQDIVWEKPNPMPESTRDRCTKAHEYVFLLSKQGRYYFDQDAILEPCSPNTHARLAQNVMDQAGSRPGDVVLDPFMGSGTVAQVALELGRAYLGCDLNPKNEALQRGRVRQQRLALA